MKERQREGRMRWRREGWRAIESALRPRGASKERGKRILRGPGARTKRRSETERERAKAKVCPVPSPSALALASSATTGSFSSSATLSSALSCPLVATVPVGFPGLVTITQAVFSSLRDRMWSRFARQCLPGSRA